MYRKVYLLFLFVIILNNYIKGIVVSSYINSVLMDLTSCKRCAKNTNTKLCPNKEE